jgi:hypothetical protein
MNLSCAAFLAADIPSYYRPFAALGETHDYKTESEIEREYRE